MTWQVLVPVKPLSLAKSRLDVTAAARREIALAMAADVLATAAAVPGCEVSVIGDHPDLLVLGVPLLPGAAGGLSAAVRAAVREINGPVAVLAGDLPSLRVTELATVLAAAAEVNLGMVADTQGTGTTLLSATAGRLLRPSYGEGSRARHLRMGAIDLGTGRHVPGLRRDVDTLEDLAAALVLGVGQATGRAVSAAAFGAVHPPAT